MSPPGIANSGEIIAAVCCVYDMNRKTLSSARGTKSVSEARAVAYSLVYGLTPLSYSEVGELFNRDGSTATSGARRIALARKRNDPEASALNRRITAIHAHIKRSQDEAGRVTNA